MSPSFSSRQQEVRRLGTALEEEIARGDTPDESFDRILRLPVQDFPALLDTMCSLCEGRLGDGDPAQIVRLQTFGATMIRNVGLFFDHNTINREFFPRLLEMGPAVFEDSPDDSANRTARYEMISAVAQLAPLMDEGHIEAALDRCIELASHEEQFELDLLLPLANFERTYRERRNEEPGSLVDGARLFCLDSVRLILETAVTELGEAEDEGSFKKAISIFPLVYDAGLSLLTILPSVAKNRDPKYVDNMTEIIDHCGWLLSRGEGFPGPFVAPSDIAMFDSVRSVLSLCSAMINVYGAEHSSMVSTIRVAKRTQPHLVGTVALNLVRRRDDVDGMVLIREMVRNHLVVEASPYGSPLSVPALIEISALAWHLDVGRPPVINAVLDRTRDPRGQFYLHKRLEGAPWG